MAIRVYIDQGHNPQNPNAGAEGNGLREQDVVFRIGVETKRLLDRDPNFEARLSRPSSETQLGASNAESLQIRVREANAWGANLFLSLHTNASDNTAASGCEGLVYRRDTSAYTIAEDLVAAIARTTGLRNRGVFLRPGLYVLRRTAMPAVLLELGFITNPGDAALLSNSPSLFAEGIYQGLLSYYGL
jgi:N-acetylmuramoyl-L-alanine amidase